MGYNCIIILGPTAVGKTALGVRIARATGAEIISADSRQVYKGLDIGSGKDLSDYNAGGIQTPYHLIDITDLTHEYSVFDYQQDFYRVFEELTVASRAAVPVVVGGTGMYLDAVIRGYDFLEVPENPGLRSSLAQKTLEELDAMLLSLKPELHTRATLRDRDRTIRAIEIETFMRTEEAERLRSSRKKRPEIRPFIIGTSLPRDQLRANIARRLRERLGEGMIDEVRRLHDNGASWERLELLGLEYRFVSEYLQGKIRTEDELYDLLLLAIGQFAKRQETWFRGMEKKQVVIHWLPSVPDQNIKFEAAMNLLRGAGLIPETM